MYIQVEYYEKATEGTEPRCFLWGQRVVKVTDLMERWTDDNSHYYKVQGDDNCVYILCFDSLNHGWEVTSFERREEIQEQIDASFRHAFRGSV